MKTSKTSRKAGNGPTESKTGDIRIAGRDVYATGRTKASVERMAKYLGITPSRALNRAIAGGVAIIKKSISLTPEYLAFVKSRAQTDYLGAGCGYRRTVSGFIQSLIAKDRAARSKSNGKGAR